jgi:hypothetical protein
LKLERWGPPLVQERYREEKACDKKKYNNNNNNNNKCRVINMFGGKVGFVGSVLKPFSSLRLCAQ